jgi:hypothetical protein
MEHLFAHDFDAANGFDRQGLTARALAPVLVRRPRKHEPSGAALISNGRAAIATDSHCDREARVEMSRQAHMAPRPCPNAMV